MEDERPGNFSADQKEVQPKGTYQRRYRHRIDLWHLSYAEPSMHTGSGYHISLHSVDRPERDRGPPLDILSSNRVYDLRQ